MINLFLQHILIGMVRLYQLCMPSLRLILGIQGHCRFYPSCSEYAAQAIASHGPFSGLILASKRLISCHPKVEGF